MAMQVVRESDNASYQEINSTGIVLDLSPSIPVLSFIYSFIHFTFNAYVNVIFFCVHGPLSLT